jgi:hypothetical protein
MNCAIARSFRKAARTHEGRIMTSANFWPNPPHELLLKSALGDGEVAIDAWQRWLKVGPGIELDVGSQRLAPQVYVNLARLGVRDPILDRLKGFYRLAWVSNQRLLRKLESVLRTFEQANVATLALKGVPLTLQVYRDPGLRPILDLDLAVQPKNVDQAIDLMIQNGWQTDGASITNAPHLPKAYSFRSADGVNLDLHFAFVELREEGRYTEAIWLRAQPLKVGVASTLAPSATDLLLHTILYGPRTDPMPPIRWVADAMRLLRGERRIDWNVMLDDALALRQMLVLRQALIYLSAREVGIPVDIQERALLYRPSRVERFEYYIDRERRPALGLANYIGDAIFRWESLDIGTLLRFSQDRWGTRGLTETMARLAKWGISLARR